MLSSVMPVRAKRAPDSASTHTTALPTAKAMAGKPCGSGTCGKSDIPRRNAPATNQHRRQAHAHASTCAGAPGGRWCTCG
jgi:hypothetical protein